MREEDHPRVCGKDTINGTTYLIAAGSPPRVRERQSDVAIFYAVDGITPACAGKTAPFSSISQPRRDHPRVCGKDDSFHHNRLLTIGSPPRVRERHNCRVHCSTSNRITPACAGKTLQKDFINRPIQDHPRVCGKDFLGKRFHVWNIGSPPRVRERPHKLTCILL